VSLIKAGVSITNISPKKGIELAGYPHFLRYNTGIHDDLYASCIYLDNGKTKIVLVCMDILFFSKVYVKEVRSRISSRINIPEKNIMISCSHTHSGPWASGRLDLEGLEKGLEPDKRYVEGLKDKLVKLIVDASRSTFEASVGIDMGICGSEKGIGGNRRDPGGEADQEVWTIGIKDMRGKLRAALLKYSLHPTVIHEDSSLVTADYPGYIRKCLSETEPGMVLLFAQGTSGDQSSRYFREGQSFPEAKRIGYAIGEAAKHVLDEMEYKKDISLTAVSKEVNIKLKEFPTEEEASARVEKTRKAVERLKKDEAGYIDIQNANLKNLGAECTLGFIRLIKKGISIELKEDELPVEVQVIGIGDSRIVALPGEIFVEFGLNIKAGSPCKKTFVITLANGCLPGYVCTKEAYREGGYEAEASMLTAESGNIIVETALSLLEDTKE